MFYIYIIYIYILHIYMKHRPVSCIRAYVCIYITLTWYMCTSACVTRNVIGAPGTFSFFSLDGFEDVLFFSLVGRNGGKFPLALWEKWHKSIKWQLSRNEKQSTHIGDQNKRRGLYPAQHICYFIPIIPENPHRYISQSGNRRLGPRVCC